MNQHLLIQNNSTKGFLLIEILIASLILTSTIAATMYLFKIGFEHLEKASISNVLSSKVPQSVNLLKSIDLEKKSGTEAMGDGVTMTWDAVVANMTRPMIETSEGSTRSFYELTLFKVNVRLNYQRVGRDYQIHVFKFRRLISATGILF